jgi:NAD(P)-dependent dehydrogenase (short-subunit alcohol dehydrogenase family)
VIFGAGAIGGVVGAMFARAGDVVVLIARGEHAARMQAEGLTLQHGDENEVVVPTVVTSVHDIDWRENDVVFVREDPSHPEIPPSTRVVLLYPSEQTPGAPGGPPPVTRP